MHATDTIHSLSHAHTNTHSTTHLLLLSLFLPYGRGAIAAPQRGGGGRQRPLPFVGVWGAEEGMRGRGGGGLQ